jgi:hypothetical protein
MLLFYDVGEDRSGVTRHVTAAPLDHADCVREPLGRIGGEHPPGPLTRRPAQELRDGRALLRRRPLDLCVEIVAQAEASHRHNVSRSIAVL